MTADKKEQKKEPTITELIDGNVGLKSQRKLLTISSLILLALTFSGAKVEEANTFILKLTFENQGGIVILLALSIAFLLPRYYSYAKPYHEKLFREWSDRMLKEPYFHQYCHHSDTVTGLVDDLAPKEVKSSYNGYAYQYHTYFCLRYIRYSWSDQYEYYSKDVVIGWKIYAKVIFIELKTRTKNIFTHREMLDVLAPYLIGSLAILSYICNNKLSTILNALTVSG